MSCQTLDMITVSLSRKLWVAFFQTIFFSVKICWIQHGTLSYLPENKFIFLKIVFLSYCLSYLGSPKAWVGILRWFANSSTTCIACPNVLNLEVKKQLLTFSIHYTVSVPDNFFPPIFSIIWWQQQRFLPQFFKGAKWPNRCC